MRSLTITAAATAAAVTLLASPGATRRAAVSEQAVAVTASSAPGATVSCEEQSRHNGAGRKHAVSDISWFQGTLEEAFTRHSHPDHRALFHF
jgi:hypothetical protein